MKRIDVIYDGQPYSIGQRSMTEVEDQITGALVSGVPSWLTVNVGEGAPHTVRLLIHTGIGISLSPVDPHDQLPPEYSYDPTESTPPDDHALV